MKKLFVGGLAVAMMGIAGTCWFVNDNTPEKVAERYLTAIIAKDYEKTIEYVDINSPLLTKERYVESLKNTYRSEHFIENSKVVFDEREEIKKKKGVLLKYHFEHDGKKYESGPIKNLANAGVILSEKNPKIFGLTLGFIKYYRFDGANFPLQTIYPQNAKVYIDGHEINDEKIARDWYFTEEQKEEHKRKGLDFKRVDLNLGRYDVKITHPLCKDYVGTVIIKDSQPAIFEPEYYTFGEDRLNVRMFLKDELYTEFGNTSAGFIKKLLDAASVRSGAETANIDTITDKSIEKAYNNLASFFKRPNGDVVTDIEFKNVKGLLPGRSPLYRKNMKLLSNVHINFEYMYKHKDGSIGKEIHKGTFDARVKYALNNDKFEPVSLDYYTCTINIDE